MMKQISPWQHLTVPPYFIGYHDLLHNFIQQSQKLGSTPWTHGVYWTSYVRSIYVICPGGKGKVKKSSDSHEWK